MSEGARLLSLLYALFRFTTPLDSLAALFLAIWGWVRLDGTPHTAYALWSVAILLFLAGRFAAASDYAVFTPTGLTEPSLSYAFQPRIQQARATGQFRRWLRDDVHLPVPVAMVRAPVQVRWLAGERPPAIAVLSPPDIPPEAYDPVEKAEVWSLWYPGSKVELGWVYVNGSESPGLRLSFAGRRLLLALEDDASCRELAALLAE